MKEVKELRLTGERALYNSKNPSVLAKGLLGLVTIKGGKQNDNKRCRKINRFNS